MARTQQLTWRVVHAQLLDIALVLAAPLCFRAYELCAVVDWLPYIERAHPALRKVRLFSGIVESIQRILQRRSSDATSAHRYALFALDAADADLRCASLLARALAVIIAS